MPKHINGATRASGLPAELIRKLVSARQAHAWSQRELASKVGLPQVHISAIETGKVVPRYNTMQDLVRVLDHDLLLVPRSLVPAVQSLIRDAQTTKAQDTDEGERSLYADSDGGEDES